MGAVPCDLFRHCPVSPPPKYEISHAMGTSESRPTDNGCDPPYSSALAHHLSDWCRLHVKSAQIPAGRGDHEGETTPRPLSTKTCKQGERCTSYLHCTWCPFFFTCSPCVKQSGALGQPPPRNEEPPREGKRAGLHDFQPRYLPHGGTRKIILALSQNNGNTKNRRLESTGHHPARRGPPKVNCRCGREIAT